MKPHQTKSAHKGEKGENVPPDPNRPVFFYMPNEPPYGLFCQWYPTDFEVPASSLTWLRAAHSKSSSNGTPMLEGFENGIIKFNCAEQFMMYCKALFFHDPKSGEKILESKDAKEQKKFGREVEGWDDYKWLSVCERVAFEGNWWKFGGEGRDWRDVLFETRERELCEASRKDKRWGIGYREKDALKYRNKWGANLLGKALMRVRVKLCERVKEIEEGVRTDWDLPSEEMWEKTGEAACE